MPYEGDAKREYQRKWIAARRAAFFADKACVICGSTESLELDHIDPATKDPRLKKGTMLWSWSKENQQVEIAKCQVLCKDCHREKTITSISTAPEHGSTAYRNGCRCDVCKETQRVRTAEYRRRRAA